MGRPKKVVEPQVQPAAERDTALDTEFPEKEVVKEIVYVPVYTPPQPRQMRVERQGQESSPMSRRFPQVRGGTCEFCGVIDPNVPAIRQYSICEHFRGMQLACSYCPESKDPDEVVRTSVLKVAEHPDKPGMLVVWCDSFECSAKHLERFKISN